MPTMGLFSFMLPVDPWNRASPKLKMPPSDATIQYPPQVGVGDIPTIGLLSGVPPIEPRNGALPKVKMPPSDAPSRYPSPTLHGFTVIVSTLTSDRPLASVTFSVAAKVPVRV